MGLRRGMMGGATVPLVTMADFFASGERGCWIDPSDLSTMFQDAAGTTPVTASGQPVGLILDKSGNGNHFSQATSARRPTFVEASGKRYLQMVRANSQFLVCANIVPLQMRTDSMHILHASKWDTMEGYPVSRSVASGNRPGRYYVWGGGAGGSGLSFAYERNTTSLISITSPFSDTAAPHTFSHTVNRSPGEIRTRIDSVVSGLPVAGWNDTTDLTLTIKTRIGAYGVANDSTELNDYFDGRLYGLVIRFTPVLVIDTTQRDAMEALMAAKI